MSMMTTSNSGGGSSNALGSLLALLIIIPAVPFALSSSLGQRVFLTLALALGLTAFVTRRPKVGIPLAVAFLFTIGGLRRALIPAFGWTAADPLLAVQALLVLVMAMNLIISRKVPMDTRLSRHFLIFIGFMLLGMINPLQGGIMVGVGGAFFFIVPVLWYYVGRRSGTHQVQEIVYWTVLSLCLLNCILGLKQYFFGFSDAERMWMAEAIKNVANAEQAIYNKDQMRMFGASVSVQEFSQTMSLGIGLCWCRVVLMKDKLLLLPIPFLGIALLLVGSRGPLVACLGVCTLIWAVQGTNPKAWIPRIAVAAAIAFIGLYMTLTGLTGNKTLDTKTTDIVERQSALLDPLGKDSTVGIHGRGIMSGFISGTTSPLGVGLGITTLANSRFGGNTTVGSTELDFSNIWLSLGVLGGILYLRIAYFVFKFTIGYWNRHRSLNALMILTILSTMFGQWLNGGMYGLAMLSFLCIGMMDRNLLEEYMTQKRARQAEEAARIRMGAQQIAA